MAGISVTQPKVSLAALQLDDNKSYSRIVSIPEYLPFLLFQEAYYQDIGTQFGHLSHQVSQELSESLESRTAKISKFSRDILTNPSELSHALSLLKFEQSFLTLLHENASCEKRLESQYLEFFGGRDSINGNALFCLPKTTESFAFFIRFVNFIQGNLAYIKTVSKGSREELEVFAKSKNKEIQQIAKTVLKKLLFEENDHLFSKSEKSFESFLNEHAHLINSTTKAMQFQCVVPATSRLLALKIKIVNIKEQRISKISLNPSSDISSENSLISSLLGTVQPILNIVKSSRNQFNLYNFFYTTIKGLAPQTTRLTFMKEYLSGINTPEHFLAHRFGTATVITTPSAKKAIADDPRIITNKTKKKKFTSAAQKKKKGSETSKNDPRKDQSKTKDFVPEEKKCELFATKRHPSTSPLSTSSSSSKEKTLSKSSSSSTELSTSSTSSVYVAPHWIHNEVSFIHHPRLTNWFRYKPGKDPLPKGNYSSLSLPQLKREKAFHSFSPIVDKLVFDRRFSFYQLRRKEDEIRHVYHLIAVFEESNGNKNFGVISYALNSEKTVCFHRYFSSKSSSDFLNVGLDHIFENIAINENDFEFVTDTDTEDNEIEGASSTPLENTLLKYTQIPDGRHNMTISIIELPENYRNQ